MRTFHRFSGRTFLVALLFGLLCTIILNTPSFSALSRGDFSLARLGGQVRGSIDEVYYASLMRDVSDGYPNLGNVSLFEHRFAQSVLGYAPLLQGYLMRWLHLSITQTVFLGDLFFPFLIAVLLYFLVLSVGASTLFTFIAAAGMMAWKGEGWLRSISPQITAVFFLGGLLGFTYDTYRVGSCLRSVCIGFLLFVHPAYAALLLFAEGFLFLHRWKNEGFRSACRQHALLIVIVIVVLAVRLSLSIGDPDPLALSDTYRRLGLVPTHLPAAPRLQIIVVLTLLAHYVVARRQRVVSHLDRIVLPVLLFASLLALWQSVLLGVDGNFGLYYTFPIQYILLLVVIRIFILVGSRSLNIVSAVVTLFLIVMTIRSARTAVSVDLSPLSVTQIETILSPLTPATPVRIVAAPLEIANFVPVFTSHYTLFTQYSRYQYATDQELAERYLSLHALFPFDDSVQLEGYPLVLGLYAGNLFGRSKTWSRLLHTIGVSENAFDLSLEDFIYHQDVRRFLADGDIDPLQTLRKYNVNTFITDKPLPSNILPFCSSFTHTLSYSLYDCDFGR